MKLESGDLFGQFGIGRVFKENCRCENCLHWLQEQDGVYDSEAGICLLDGSFQYFDGECFDFTEKERGEK